MSELSVGSLDRPRLTYDDRERLHGLLRLLVMLPVVSAAAAWLPARQAAATPITEAIEYE